MGWQGIPCEHRFARSRPLALREGDPGHFSYEWGNLVLTPFNSPLSNKGEDYAKFTLEQQGGIWEVTPEQQGGGFWFRLVRGFGS